MKTEYMSQQRYTNALEIAGGACNPRAIARALVRAIDEACNEDNRGYSPVGKDPAVRLIAHQLIHVLCKRDIYDLGLLFPLETDALTAYEQDVWECQQRLQL